MNSEPAKRTEAAPITIRRIAIALDCSSINPGALRTAVALAAATKSELQAIFVEDQCLHELAQLPLARQVSYSGRSAQPFKAQDMRREIDRAAEAARRTISHEAARARIAWAFDTMRGLLEDKLKEVSERAEILALGSSKAKIGRVHRIDVLRRTLRHGAGVIVAPPDFEPDHGPVLAVIARGADVGAMVRTAESLSERLDRPTQFVVACSDRGECGSLEAQVRELAGADAVIVPCESGALDSITMTVWRTRASIVIADIDYACLDEATSLERVSETFGCPVLLVQV